MPIITPATVRVEDAGHPQHPCGPTQMLRYSDTGGLTQFGAYVQTLPPGSRSSLCHWHQGEDEFVYMLEGEATVYEGGLATLLRPGEAACFKAGVAAGHFLKNEGTVDARFLTVGTRSGADVVTYPDHDRILTFDDRAGTESFTTLDGRTAVGSPYFLPGA
jgi:uncharacterized cupin superfamily protein